MYVRLPTQQTYRKKFIFYYFYRVAWATGPSVLFIAQTVGMLKYNKLSGQLRMSGRIFVVEVG